jgi:NADP-dependent 3-hydroxy acid dehydrogenase YdfG
MKNVIVISGATSGIGEGLSKKFINLGWNVVGLARNEYKLKQIERDLGENFIGIRTDLQKEKDVIKAFDYIKKVYSKINLLVNNAGVFKNEKFINCSFEDINSIIDTNLKGTIYSTLKAIEIMIHSGKSGRIINIGSVASIHGIENQSIYCASKYGLNGFAEALNQELIGHNISISTIFPGGINTPLWNESNPYPGDHKDKILHSADIVNIIEYISTLEQRIVLKNLTIFPSNEWH